LSCYNNSGGDKKEKISKRDKTKLNEFYLTYERRAVRSKSEEARQANAIKALKFKEELDALV
jgi:hypothetical protein